LKKPKHAYKFKTPIAVSCFSPAKQGNKTQTFNQIKQKVKEKGRAQASVLAQRTGNLVELV
jgi:hypothetical protein